jgi:3-oxoacyl-[acyl-carrier protein] reductase
MVREAVDRWGRIDALVNNAATTKFCAHDNLEGLTQEDFIRIYATNLVGPYQMIRAAAPHMKAQGRGAVVNVASTAGVNAVGSCVAYCASKGALITMTKALARALAPEIRVNAVCPGFIQGDWLRDGMGAENYERLKGYLEATNPLRRTGTPETIAPNILFLLEDAVLTTGEILLPTGGTLWAAWVSPSASAEIQIKKPRRAR